MIARTPGSRSIPLTTLHSVLGQHDLDDMLAEREKLNSDIQRMLDQNTETWGIKRSRTS